MNSDHLHILSTKKVSFAIVDTNWGTFQVWASGGLRKWDNDLYDWNPISFDDVSAGDFDGIIQAGLDLIAQENNG